MRKIETKAKALQTTRAPSDFRLYAYDLAQLLLQLTASVAYRLSAFLGRFFLFPFPFVLDAIVCCLKLEFEEQGVFCPKAPIVGSIY